jgi:hypothetical protein
LILGSILFRGPSYLTFWNQNYEQKPIFARDFRCTYYFFGALFKEQCYYIYDDAELAEYVRKVKPDAEFIFVPYYPPFVYLSSVPLAYFKASVACKINFILNHLYLFFTVFFMNMLFLQKRGFKTILLLSLGLFFPLLLFSPVMDNLLSGQINIFLTFLFSLFLYFHFKKNYLMSTFVLALAINTKIFPLFILLYFVIKGEWKNILYTLVFSILVNVPFLFLTNPLKLYGGLITKVSSIVLETDIYQLQTLQTTIIRLFGINMSSSATILFNRIVMLAVSTGLLIALYRINKRQSISSGFKDLFLATLSLDFLFLGSYYVFPTHHVLIVPFFIIALHYFLDYCPDDTGFMVATMTVFFLISYFDGEVAAKIKEIYFRGVLLANNIGFFLIFTAFLLNMKFLLDGTADSGGRPQPMGQEAPSPVLP